MAKQNFLDKHFNAILILAVLVVGAYWANGQTWDFSKFSLGNLFTIVTNVNIAGQNNTQGNQTPTIITKTNLCQAYQPIINYWAAYYGVHPSTACTVGGGDWVCNANAVGCYGFDAASINCTMGFYTYVNAQCAAYGAMGVCTPINAYCQY